MTVLDLIVSTTLPWAILHLVRFLYSNRQHKLVRNILPLPLSGDPGASRRRGTWEIGPLWLKYETTRWNSVFSYSVLTLFSRGRRRRLLDGNTPGSATLARWGTRFYIVGAALCVLAMALGMILLFWSALALVWRVARLLTGGTESLEPDALREGMTRVVKRFINEGETTNNDAKLDRPRLHVLVRLLPILPCNCSPSVQVPGITVPLSHLPILVLGLAFSGIIHEAGHAIAASLYVSSYLIPLRALTIFAFQKPPETTFGCSQRAFIFILSSRHSLSPCPTLSPCDQCPLACA